jgi:hypothetical protein
MFRAATAGRAANRDRSVSWPARVGYPATSVPVLDETSSTLRLCTARTYCPVNSQPAGVAVSALHFYEREGLITAHCPLIAFPPAVSGPSCPRDGARISTIGSCICSACAVFNPDDTLGAKVRASHSCNSNSCAIESPP